MNAMRHAALLSLLMAAALPGADPQPPCPVDLFAGEAEHLLCGSVAEGGSCFIHDAADYRPGLPASWRAEPAPQELSLTADLPLLPPAASALMLRSPIPALAGHDEVQ